MSDFRERYEGDFLAADDLAEGQVFRLTIEATSNPGTEKDKAGRLIENGILQFKGAKKRLILGKTNYLVLKRMYGGEPKDWIGKEACLQRRYLPAKRAWGQHNQRALRIIPPKGTPLPRTVLEFMGSATPLPGD